MGNFIQVPKSEMKTLGDRINFIKSMLEQQKNEGRVIEHLDTRHGRPHVMVAEEGFVDAWETAIKKLLEALGGTGDLAVMIGSGAIQIDGEVAKTAKQATDGLAKFDLHT